MTYRVIESNNLNLKIKEQWNKLAEVRNKQQREKNDLTYESYLKPIILLLCKNSDLSSVLDLGCGNGYLTESLAAISGYIEGIDISDKNIEIAKRCSAAKNVKYIQAEAYNYLIHNDTKYSTIVASMFLQDCFNFKEVCSLAYDSLRNGGSFILSITHPCFWPKYWNYESEDWFQYDQELIIEGGFKISSSNYSCSETIHFHRPIEMYLNVLKNSGFNMEEFIEIKTYNNKFKFPRFLAIKCTR